MLSGAVCVCVYTCVPVCVPEGERNAKSVRGADPETRAPECVYTDTATTPIWHMLKPVPLARWLSPCLEWQVLLRLRITEADWGGQADLVGEPQLL